MTPVNHQLTGAVLAGWKPPVRPGREEMRGRFCRLAPLDPDAHAAALFAANSSDTEGRMWTYLPYGPFASEADYRAWMVRQCAGEDPLFFAIIDVKTGWAAGVAAYLRIDPANGVVEIGHLAYSPALQRTAAATEAMYLMIDRVFALGYRRCEWKCDALNAPSRTAAERLGFTFEGIFRQAVVVKGRNRDTAWHSIIDGEWLARRSMFGRWLAPENFDAAGRQRTKLGATA